MSSLKEDYSLKLETLIGIFTVDKGKIKILMMRKKAEPYKGYWVLPTTYVSIHETCMEAITRELEEKFHFTDLELEEVSTCSTPDRMLDVPVMAVSYLGFMSDLEALKLTTEVSFETKWFDIHELPKIGYDHQEILQNAMEKLKDKLLDSEVLKKIFPSDFTLPEIQKIYESILGRKFDRRNFRKKFISLGLIEDTNDYDMNGVGRPAKLYRFKEHVSVKKLF